MMGWLLLGVGLGGLFIGVARRLRWPTQVQFFAVCLFLAGATYFLFGLFHGPRWVAVEGIGVVLFGLLAYAGLRWPLVLALGWLLHVGWDVGLHLAMEQPVIGPWLPLLCLPFDMLVAGYLAFMTVQNLGAEVSDYTVPTEQS